MIAAVVSAPPSPQVRKMWLPRLRGEKLHYAEAPARMAIAVGLGWSGKAIMMSAPVFGKLFFIPLTVGALPLAMSGLLLVSGPAKVVIDRQAGNVKRRRRGIRLPGTTNQALHLFDEVKLVCTTAKRGGWSARFRSTLARLTGAADTHHQAWEVHLSSKQEGVAAVVLGGFGPDRATARAVAEHVAEFTGLAIHLGDATPAPAERAA